MSAAEHALARCQGTRYCDEKTASRCERCGRPLCGRHVIETMCSPKGKHRMHEARSTEPPQPPAEPATEETTVATTKKGPTEPELRAAWEKHGTCRGVAEELGLKGGAAAFQKLKSIGIDARSKKPAAAPTRPKPSSPGPRPKPKRSGVRVLDRPPVRVDCPGCGHELWVVSE